MIKCQVFGDDDIHGHIIDLPACPRVGDTVSHMKVFRVTRVIFTSNERTVVLWLEQSA